jgi:hypothetical protein
MRYTKQHMEHLSRTLSRKFPDLRVHEQFPSVAIKPNRGERFEGWQVVRLHGKGIGCYSEDVSPVMSNKECAMWVDGFLNCANLLSVPQSSNPE